MGKSTIAIEEPNDSNMGATTQFARNLSIELSKQLQIQPDNLDVIDDLQTFIETGISITVDHLNNTQDNSNP